MKNKTYKKLLPKIRRTSRKMSFKHGGNKYHPNETTNNSYVNKHGIVDNIENKVSGITSDVANNIYDTSRKFADQGKEALIQNINDFIESPKISKITEAGENYLSDFNERIDNPVFKKQVNETLNNMSDYAELGLKAMDKPIDDAIDKLNESGTKAASGTISSVIKVGTDAMAAIPGLGAIIELGKIANDASKGISSVVDASSQAAETVDDFLTETNENITKFTHAKQQGGEIIDRTIHSINEFHKPLFFPSAMKGGNGYYKTKKRLLRRKNKTRRVRFNL
jgi:methyl-accepting chemotaxis protein